ncbi:hypothetical protein ACW5WG_19240, partial [Aeromonas salmonicida]
DADLRGMVVLRSLGFQLVPFKLHRFRKQRLPEPVAQRFRNIFPYADYHQSAVSTQGPKSRKG